MYGEEILDSFKGMQFYSLFPLNSHNIIQLLIMCGQLTALRTPWQKTLGWKSMSILIASQQFGVISH